MVLPDLFPLSATVLLRRVCDGLQIDRSLAFALSARVWQTVSGPITIALLIHAMTLPERGVYYAIVGIVGIQAYFELGLLNVLVSHASRETAVMQRQGEGETATHQATNAAARMRDLMATSIRWFGFAAVVYGLVAIGFGWVTLDRSDVSWRGPLIALIPLAAISMALAPWLSILEGAGFRDLIYRFRFIQMILGSISVWLALATGLKIWALVFASAVQAALAIYIIAVEKRAYFQQFRLASLPKSDFSWSRDVMPMQWRVALMGAAFHFATQLFTVIVILFHSDTEAAPLGMTLSVTGSIQMLALAWVQTKYPLVSTLHGGGDREAAGTLWRKTAIVSSSLLLIACITLIGLIAAMPLLGRGLEASFLTPWQTTLLAIGCLANHITAVQGFYVLAQRAKPLLAASLTGAIAIGAMVWLGGYWYSTDGVVAGYAAGMALVLLPLHTWAYAQFRIQDSVTPGDRVAS